MFLIVKLVVSDSMIVFIEILNSSDLWVNFTKLVFLQGCQQMPKPSVHSYLANFYSRCTIRNLRSPLARCSDPPSKQCYLLKRYQQPHTTTIKKYILSSHQPPAPLASCCLVVMGICKCTVFPLLHCPAASCSS